MPLPPLRSLHPSTSLLSLKLEEMSRASTEALLKSLVPGQKDSLKVRADGTILDGHHRIAVLRNRGVAVDELPREVVPKKELE